MSGFESRTGRRLTLSVLCAMLCGMHVSSRFLDGYLVYDGCTEREPIVIDLTEVTQIVWCGPDKFMTELAMLSFLEGTAVIRTQQRDGYAFVALENLTFDDVRRRWTNARMNG